MGKRLDNIKKDIDANRIYPFAEALALVKKTATIKFVGNLELHLRLGIDPKKTDQIVRGTVTLPFGTGKKKRIIAFVNPAREKEALEAGAIRAGGEEIIKEIKEKQVINFDIAIAEPSLMPKLAVIAKILGPKGLMPNPKTGTVTEDILKAIKEYSTGKLEFKNDQSGNIHIILGKINFENDQLNANFKAFADALSAAKPMGLKKEFIVSAYIHSTMGPSVKIKI
jgi:large subunit ribosomal protein L1